MFGAPRQSRGAPLHARQSDEKGPDARRRPKHAREAYCLYVERACEGCEDAPEGCEDAPEGGNEAAGAFSSLWRPQS